jgi:hypothetical protein
MIGQKSMPADLSETRQTEVRAAVIATLAFFSLYDLPLHVESVHQLLYKCRATLPEVSEALKNLVYLRQVVQKGNLYALSDWDESARTTSKIEIEKRWRKVDRYFGILSIVPFISHVSIINSLAFDNAHMESDIDFFVVTRPHRLYFVRSIIIVIFRLLGVYKTRTKIHQQFCFGFYVTTKQQELGNVLLDQEDPLFAFWFASFAPLLNQTGYEQLVSANRWVYDYFPNFDFHRREVYIKKRSQVLAAIKYFLEIVLFIPAAILEPLLRSIHIRHTFNLPENHWPTATTIANDHMLKLHALDPRKEIRERFHQAIAVSK